MRPWLVGGVTRPAAEMDAIAEFLLAAGARALESFPVNAETSPFLAQLL